MKRVKKTITWLTCIVMMVTFIPIIGLPAVGADNSVYADEEDVIEEIRVNGFGDVSSDPFTVQNYCDTIAELLDTEFDPVKMGGLAVKYLLPHLLGIQEKSDNEKILESLSEILQNQSQISEQLQKILETIHKQELIGVLNDYFFKEDPKNWVATYYKNLKDIDNGDFGDFKNAEDARMDLLVNIIPNTPPSSNSNVDNSGVLCPLDGDAYEMGRFFVEKHLVDYGSDDILGITHMLCKYTFQWENQSYNAWLSLRNAEFTKYIMAASIDKLSLQARIKVAQQQNDTVGKTLLEDRLDMLTGQMKEVMKLYKDSSVTKLPDNVRQYQYPGHELRLYSNAKHLYVPEEKDKDIGVSGKLFDAKQVMNLEGITAHQVISPHYATYVVDGLKLDFWRPFATYNIDGGGTAPCPSLSWLQDVYQDSGGRNLYDVFFDSKQGDFDPPHHSDNSWEFVVNPKSSYGLSYYNGGKLFADEVVAPVVQCNGKFDGTARNEKGRAIYAYHYYSNEVWDKVAEEGQPFIGIGVVKGQGSEQYDFDEDYEALYTSLPLLHLDAANTAEGFKLTWNQMLEEGDNAAVTVYSAKAGKNKYKAIQTIDGGNTSEVLIPKSKLKNKTGYQYYVRLSKTNEEGEEVSLSSNKVIIYPKNGKYTNVKKIALAKGIKSELSLRKGTTKSIGGKVIKENSKKTLPKGWKAIRYESSNPLVATVSAKGRITAKKTCGESMIYAYGPNGVCRTINVIVK